MKPFAFEVTKPSIHPLRLQVRNERAIDALTAELDDLEEEMSDSVAAAIKGRAEKAQVILHVHWTDELVNHSVLTEFPDTILGSLTRRKLPGPRGQGAKAQARA